MIRDAKQTRSSATAATLVFAFGMLAAAAPAQAQEEDDFLAEILLGVFAAAVADGSLMVAGGVFAMGNFTYVVNPHKASSKPWENAGYVIGALNMAAGAALVGLYADEPAYGKITLTAGLVNLGIGALDIGLALWGSQEPEHEAGLKVAVRPLILPDLEGNTAVGAGVAVVGW